MDSQAISRFIKNEIEENYGTYINFCRENKIGYKRFLIKLKGMKNDNDFRYIPINKILNILGYEFTIVKKSKTEK